MDKSQSSTWKIPWKGIIVAFVCSAAALALVFSKVAKPQDILRELEAFPLRYFFAALFFVLSAWIVDGQRIAILARTFGFKAPWWQLALLLGAANFLTLVTPFAGGGGALVIYFLYRGGVSVPRATAIVTAGGIAGQLSLSALVFFMFSTITVIPAGLVRYVQIIRFSALGYIVILSGLLLIVTRKERWLTWLAQKRGEASRSAAWLQEFQAAYRQILGESFSYYLVCLVIALLYYVVYYTGGFVLLTAFGAFGPWLRFAISVLFGIAPVFSPIPGGAGASELVAFLVLDDILPLEALGTFIILWRTVVFYLPIILGGSVFTYLMFRWATLSSLAELRKKSDPDVILPSEDDHNR